MLGRMPGKAGDEALGDAGAQIVPLRVAAQVREGQDRDRGPVGQREGRFFIGRRLHPGLPRPPDRKPAGGDYEAFERIFERRFTCQLYSANLSILTVPARHTSE